MLIKFPASFGSVWKRAYLKVAAVIVSLAIIGLSTIGHYGVSWDENVEISMVRFNFELITQGKPIPSDYKYYGTAFNLTSEIIFQIQSFIQKGFDYNPLNDAGIPDERLKYKVLYERIKVKHVLTFLVSLITYASVAGLVGILCGREYAWFGAVALPLIPRFWGHSFFNPKDTPFAAFFTLSTLLGAYLVNHYLKANQESQLKFNRTLVYSILYGILVGWLTAIRIVGFFVLFFVALAYLVGRLGANTSYRSLRNISIYYGATIVAWAITTVALQPASWSNPIAWFVETISYMSKHGWGGEVLFKGQFISAKALPWYYLPTWVVITVPVIFQVSFVLGLIFLVIKYSKFSKLQRACAVLVLLQFFCLPLLAILRDSTLYDEMRQFLFILPGVAAISAAALVWIYQTLSKKSLKLVAVAFMVTVFGAIAFDMVALHPYEYIYFNRVSGGLAKAHGRYETDYWALSTREGMEWINNNASDNTKVVVGGDDDSAIIFAAPKLTAITKTEFEQKPVDKPFYYLAVPRYDLQQAFPECQVVHQVVKQNVPLTIVKECK